MKLNNDTLRGYEWLLVLLLLVPTAFITGRCTAPAPRLEPRTRDTVVVTRYDTITREKPVYLTRRVIDTMRIPVVDTVRFRDTLFLTLEREQRTYGDSVFRAWVSGYDPRLDSIRIRNTVRCVTVTERVPVGVPRKWGLGVTAGYGAAGLKDGTVQLAPFVGLGVTYNILSW